MPLKEEYSLSKRLVDLVSRVFGRKTAVVVLVPRLNAEDVLIHTPGNVTRSNPLHIPTYPPRSVAPADPDLMGTLYRALQRLGVDVHIASTHDPPSSSENPHLIVRVPPALAEDVVASVVASVSKKKVFIPYLAVGRGFLADRFSHLIRKRKVPAYYIPFYWSHFLDEEMLALIKRVGGVRGIVVESGLELPWKLSEEKSGEEL